MYILWPSNWSKRKGIRPPWPPRTIDDALYQAAKELIHADYDLSLGLGESSSPYAPTSPEDRAGEIWEATNRLCAAIACIDHVLKPDPQPGDVEALFEEVRLQMERRSRSSEDHAQDDPIAVLVAGRNNMATVFSGIANWGDVPPEELAARPALPDGLTEYRATLMQYGASLRRWSKEQCAQALQA